MGLTLVTPDDPLTAITATPLIHFPDDAPILYVTKDGIPQVTLNEIKRLGDTGITRFNNVDAFLVGAAANPGVESELKAIGLKYVEVKAASIPELAKDDPIDTAIAFAKMWDSAGEVGWKITGPGHGFTLVRIDDWQAAVASAPLSHLGFHAPVLFTDSATTLPAPVDGYLRAVAPTYLTSPADGPYNMTYVLGSWSRIGWPLQAHVDYISEMANRRLWNQNTGGRYSDSTP